MNNTAGRLIAWACLLAALMLAHFFHEDVAVATAANAGPTPSQSVTINAEQARQVHVTAVGEHDFAPYVDAVGYLDFDQDHLAQVNSPYAGRVREVFAKAGDTVKRGQPLFSLDSPDLAQAEGTLVSTAAAWAQTRTALERAKGMAQVQANAPRDLEQAIADAQTAEGNYQAARRALHIFGKSDADIDRIATHHTVDGELRIDSPIDGQVAQRSIAPGDVVQPGSTPAPFNVSAPSTLWLVVNVVDADALAVHPGQPINATLSALPDQHLCADVDYVSNASDAGTHRVTVRGVLKSPPPGLRPQMLVDAAIRTAPPVRHAAVPTDAVVREGDGTMVVFVTQDGLRFTRQPVTLGEPQGGYYPVLSGLSPRQQVAAEGALFLSNALALQTQ